MNVELLTNPVTVRNRLAQLGTSLEPLFETAMAMVAEMRDTTENDAPGAAYARAYYTGVRRLRDTHCANGSAWMKDSSGGIQSIFHPDFRVRIAVSSTDAGTGLENHFPQQRSPKGAATSRLISTNYEQLEFWKFEEISPLVSLPSPASGGPIASWYLCVFCHDEEIRAELSCPISCDDDSLFTDFNERICIIGGGENNDPTRRKQPEPDEALDIPVTRKTA